MGYLTVDDCRLYYMTQGEGIPIVFIHPPMITHLNFEYQLKELSKYFQVIAFDIRGHGRSSFSRQQITYSLIVDDIRKLLDYLQIKTAVIVGYSTGGSIALEFMLSYPERAIGGVVISGMSEVSDWKLRNKIEWGVAFSKRRTKDLLAFVIAWSNTKNISSFQKVWREEQRGNIQNIKQYYRYSLIYRCTDRLAEIKRPVLLIYGEKDKGFHRYAKLLHRELPRGKLKWIPGVKHQLPTKAAPELNEAIAQFALSLQAEEDMRPPSLETAILSLSEEQRHPARETVDP